MHTLFITCVRKVGACLSKKEILKKVIENNGGIAKTSDFAANGINKCEVASFCKEGIIEILQCSLQHGLPSLVQQSTIHEEKNHCIHNETKRTPHK